MNVNIYSEPLVDIQGVMTQFFGQAYDTAVYDMALIFCFLTLIIFIFCILGCLFRSSPRK